jgi:hypothetical protein
MWTSRRRGIPEGVPGNGVRIFVQRLAGEPLALLDLLVRAQLEVGDLRLPEHRSLDVLHRVAEQ